MGDLLATLRRRDLALLWSGGLITLTGDWMLLVALPIAAHRTRNGLAVDRLLGCLRPVMRGDLQ